MNLRKARKSSGLMREFVAENLEISPDHLNFIERGGTQAKLTQIKKFSKMYNIPFGEMAEIALATYERRE